MRLDLRRALVFLIVAFVVLSIWNNPTGTADSFSNFLGDVGSFLEDFLDKATDFFKGLTSD